MPKRMVILALLLPTAICGCAIAPVLHTWNADRPVEGTVAVHAPGDIPSSRVSDDGQSKKAVPDEPAHNPFMLLRLFRDADGNPSMPGKNDTAPHVDEFLPQLDIEDHPAAEEQTD